MGKNYVQLKKEAVRLRRRGLSYNVIRKNVGVSKSTLSVWLKQILLKPEQQKRLYTKQIQILSRGSKSQKERRAREVEGILQKAILEISTPLSQDTYRLMGAALYWGEGSKGKRFQLTNSDPAMIVFMVHWIKEVLGIPPASLKARLNIYPQQSEKAIKRFWSDLTHIPLENFGKSYIKPLSTGYKKNNLYYGTMRVEIPKSADLQHRIQGWIRAALKEVVHEIEHVELKWRILKDVARPVNIKNNPPIA
ncbi:MAG: hypothetical protein HZA35_00590 [Parcubacteria group bacterium]|nr:hypothetical protein [Parcubacteria group bacterium]